MTQQEIVKGIEDCINTLRDVDIPSRLADTSGRTITNVCALLIKCGRGVYELKLAPEPEKTEE